MEQTGGCNGNRASCASRSDCGGCGGCGTGGGTLYLTEEEIHILRRFGEIPFWPVARRADAETPICLEEGFTDKTALSALSQKGLIRLDFDLPLANFDYAAYAAYPHHGSMALTASGQRAVELLEIQGIEE